MVQDNNKVTIVGCGNVGMSAAYAMLLRGLVNELCLIDINKARVTGEKLDLTHGMPFMGYATVEASDDYAIAAKSDIVVVTAGAAQKPGETRLDLAKKNRSIISSIIPKIVQHAPDAVILMVSNPLDVLTYTAWRESGLPWGRVFGSGTTLDSARFRVLLGEEMGVNPNSVEASLLGEHGDSSFPFVSPSCLAGKRLVDLLPGDKISAAYEKARNAAYEIIREKGATYYAIGAVISHIVEEIFRDTRNVLPLSVPLKDYNGVSDVALSVPCVIGRSGVQRVLETKMSDEELAQFQKSAALMAEYLK